MLRTIGCGVAVAVLTLAGWRLHHAGYESGLAVGKADVDALQSQMRQAQAEAEASARDIEHQHAAQLSRLAEQYEQERQDAQATADRTIADLRDGAIRLRNEWQGCTAAGSVPAAAGSAGSADDGAALRAAGAADLVRAAAECDAQVRGLQDALRSERQ